MRLKSPVSRHRQQRRFGPPIRQCAALLLAGALLSACEQRPPVGEVGNVRGFYGGIAAEEPRAVLTGQDVLSAGGSAADAAVAAFFTMVASYPVAVGVGGGGICAVYDSRTNLAQTLEFLPRRPEGGGLFAVPGSLRGMAALHARYGRLPWTELIAGAESQARFGIPVSRALATRLAAQAATIANEPDLRALFARPDGSMKQESDPLVQVELAATLSAVRSRGIGDFYGGQSGRTFVDGVRAAGGQITVDDLRGYRPIWRETLKLEFGNEVMHVATAPPDGGPILHELVRRLRSQAGAEGFAAASAEVYARATGARLDDAGDAAVAVADRNGNAVACAFTMNGDFGLGIVAGDSGIIAAPADSTAGAYLAPFVLANQNVDEAYLAGAASGGAAGPAALARVALGVLAWEESLEAAVAARRQFRPGPQAPLVSERAPESVQGRVVEVARLGRVQAVWCPKGIRSAPELCSAASDTRGFGLAAGGGQ